MSLSFCVRLGQHRIAVVISNCHGCAFLPYHSAMVIHDNDGYRRSPSPAARRRSQELHAHGRGPWHDPARCELALEAAGGSTWTLSPPIPRWHFAIAWRDVCDAVSVLFTPALIALRGGKPVLTRLPAPMKPWRRIVGLGSCMDGARGARGI